VKSTHEFAVSVEWTGNRGEGTRTARGFGREHIISAPGKEAIRASSARVFHGDAALWNPEEELIAALSQCHMLSYLYVAAAAGVVVEEYRDAASGILVVDADGAGRFREAVLRPVVTISAGDRDRARELHAEARALCFIANSVNFPVRHEPELVVRA